MTLCSDVDFRSPPIDEPLSASKFTGLTIKAALLLGFGLTFGIWKEIAGLLSVSLVTVESIARTSYRSSTSTTWPSSYCMRFGGVSFRRLLSVDLTTHQAIREKTEHHQSNGDVHPISTPQEADERNHNPRNWRGDQEEQPKLNESAPAERPRVRDDPADRSQVIRFASEHVILRPQKTMPRQIENSSAQDDSRRS